MSDGQDGVGQLLSAPCSVLGIIPKVRGDFSPSLVEGPESHERPRKLRIQRSATRCSVYPKLNN
jgi:hypothetical protein